MSEVIKVNRNTVLCPFPPQSYQRGEKKKAGDIFLAPDIVVDEELKDPEKQISLSEFIRWATPQIVVNKLQGWMNLNCQSAYETATTKVVGTEKNDKGEDVDIVEDKPFDQDEFIRLMAGLSARGESKEQLNTRLFEQIELLNKIAADMQLAQQSGDTELFTKYTMKMVETGQEINGIKASIQNKSRERKSKVAVAA